MDALACAHEINDFWADCMTDAGVIVVPRTCPTDELVARIIEKHLEMEEENKGEKLA